MIGLENFEIDHKFENSYYTSRRDVVENKVDANFVELSTMETNDVLQYH